VEWHKDDDPSKETDGVDPLRARIFYGTIKQGGHGVKTKDRKLLAQT
jgi:hypothetical protein